MILRRERGCRAHARSTQQSRALQASFRNKTSFVHSCARIRMLKLGSGSRLLKRVGWLFGYLFAFASLSSVDGVCPVS
jgi:hypothetical protein